jgi:hypothetical protein
MNPDASSRGDKPCHNIRTNPPKPGKPPIHSPLGQINVTPVIEQVLIPNIIEVNIKIDLSRWNCGMNILSTRVQKEQKSEKRQQFFHHQKDYPIITCFVQLLFSFLAESIENSYIFES